MKVYRLTTKEHCNDLSGFGSAAHGGRWNSKDVFVVYTSQSRALCVAEVAVHAQLGIIPDYYSIVIIEIPDELEMLKIKISDLENDWRQFPYSLSTIQTGDSFIRDAKYPVMEVPSAVVPGDFNYLLNPLHPEFHKIKIISTEAFEFDRRLIIKQ